MVDRARASRPDSEGPSGTGETLLAAPGEAQSGSGSRRVADDPWIGREVAGRYRIVERLGEGGMGMVYVAEHLHLKRRLALKVIHPDLARSEALLSRFEREALATGQLDHPHIAAAIDFGALEGGGAFMVMPLVRGHALQREVDLRGPLGVGRVAALGAQIADALAAAHALGIVHRDLKPDNVLLEPRSDGSEAAKVLDFGVASLGAQAAQLSVDARPLTQAGTILGTPGYMSPEQASAGEVDHRTDLYALGVILWELARGERLFDGDDITQIFAKQFHALPPALELGAGPRARALEALVARLLAWDKAARPESAEVVREALREIAAMPEDPQRTGAGKWLAARWPRHPRERAGLWIGVLVALSLGLGLAVLTRDDDDVSGAEPGVQAEHALGAVQRAELAEAEQKLSSREREQRRDAAKRVLRFGDAAPRHLQLVADLELAAGCAGRKKVIGQMRDLGDPRVLPALDRLSAQPAKGCGVFKLSDCLACLRKDLDQAITALEKPPPKR
ncbi:MAG: serine/threonine-protein kinase [Polyangiales bacterium]